MAKKFRPMNDTGTAEYVVIEKRPKRGNYPMETVQINCSGGISEALFTAFERVQGTKGTQAEVWEVIDGEWVCGAVVKGREIER